jgi:hypothetical protein
MHHDPSTLRRVNATVDLLAGALLVEMEIDITALVPKTRARTYEVPISYYGRSYEEDKKISWRDGIMAVLYILRYNLVTPHFRRGRRYIAEVNESSPPGVRTAGSLSRRLEPKSRCKSVTDRETTIVDPSYNETGRFPA